MPSYHSLEYKSLYKYKNIAVYHKFLKLVQIYTYILLWLTPSQKQDLDLVCSYREISFWKKNQWNTSYNLVGSSSSDDAFHLRFFTQTYIMHIPLKICSPYDGPLLVLKVEHKGISQSLILSSQSTLDFHEVTATIKN